MDASPRGPGTLDAEALLAQASWVRALVQRLVSDEHLAEDVVQDTFVAALERPPTRGSSAWLSVVARNLALRRRRRERAHVHAERSAARPEAIDGGQEVVERMQLQRRLVDAILALPEPYRRALILRYLDGHAPEEIARRERCSNAAARQRVSRGVAILRERLDRGLGANGAWCAAFVSIWKLGEPQAAAPWIGGGLAVGTKAMLATVALAGAAALGVGVWWRASAPSSAASAPHPLATVAEARNEAPLELSNAAPIEARTALENDSPPPTADSPSSTELLALAALAPKPIVLRGRVLDPTGLPARPPGIVAVEVIDAEGRVRSSDAELDLQGRYEVQGLAVGTLRRVRARAAGFGWGEVAPEIALVEGSELALDVTLTRGAIVTGTVLDASSRAPVAGAEVWSESYRPGDDGEPWAITASDGRFRLEGAQSELRVDDEGRRLAIFDVKVRAPGYAPSPTAGQGAPENPDATYDFELLLTPATCTFAARLFMPARTSVAAGAFVHGVDSRGNLVFAVSHEDGSLEIGGVPAGPLGLAIGELDDAHSLGGAQLRTTIEVEPGAQEVHELELEPRGSTSVAGRVVDLDGHPLAGVPIRLEVEFEANGVRFVMHELRAETDANGGYRFDGLSRGPHALTPQPAGNLCARPHTEQLALEPGETRAGLDFRIAPPMSVEGWVDAGALSLADLEVQVRAKGSDDVLDSQRPGANGAFHIGGLFPETCDVVVVRENGVLCQEPIGPSGASGLVLRPRLR